MYNECGLGLVVLLSEYSWLCVLSIGMHAHNSIGVQSEVVKATELLKGLRIL